MNDEVSKVFDRLDKESKKELLSEILSRIQLSGGGSSFEDKFSSGYGYGGRIGYRQPLGDDALTVGVTGSGFKAKTPFGTFGQRGITGGDIGYEFGDNRLALKYDQNGVMAGVPLKDLLQLIYQRRF
jgi:hypothetical protein